MKATLLPILFFIFSFLSFNATAQTSGIPCPAGCDTDPLCVQEDNCFRFEYFGAVDQGNGTTQLKFKVTNASRYPFSEIMFELPGQNQAAVSPQSSYISRFHYAVTNPVYDSLIRFTGLNTTTFRYDQSDVFRYVVDSATFHNGSNSTIEVVAKAAYGSTILVGTVTFNLEECEDMPIFALPVSLTTFTGATTAQGAALNWETASEKNNSHFSVQHSTDGRNFESAGYVEGNGTSNTAHRYAFTHTQPKAGMNYYRLKQVDFDGTTAYSKTIVLESKGRQAVGLTVYPNPVTNGQVNLRLDQAMNSTETATIELRDLNGRLLLTREMTGARELNLNLSNQNLKAGIYLISLKNGASATHQKIVIQ